MKNWLLIAGLLTSCGLYAQVLRTAHNGQLQILTPESGPEPWTSLSLNNSSDQFQFAIVTDRTGGHRPGIFEKGVSKLNLLQPEFVMSVGDLIEGYTEDLTVLEREWNEFDGFVQALEMPFFYVPGNHDITNQVMEQVWKDRLGLTHYYFIYKDVLFLALNSEDQYRGAGRGSIATPQYEWIQEVLAQHQDVKWTLVFMHQPLWVQETDPVRWGDVEKLLANRKHTVFAGHRHNYQKFERNNANYFMLATTGGGSPLRGPQFGEFDHVVWVTMTAEGPIIANLQLEGVWDENVMTSETKAAIDALTNARPIQIEPLYDGSTTTRIKITNDFDVPLKATVKTKFSWSYKSDLDQNELEIAPNSVGFIELELEAKGAQQMDKDPVEIGLTVSYAADLLPKVGIPFTYYLAKEQRYTLETSGAPIAIDGKLEEWASLPYQFGAESSDDLQVSFGARYDDEFLYLGAQVMDDELLVKEGSASWQNDNIIFVVNADPLVKSAMQDGSGYYRGSAMLSIAPEVQGRPSGKYFEDRLPEGSKVICVETEGGYVLEAAIPMSYIQEKQGENWQTLRINMGVRDADSDTNEAPIYTWNPDWKRIGSGMFFKN